MEQVRATWAGVRPARWCGEWLCPVSLWLVFCSNLLGSLCEPVDGASVPSAMWETNASVLKWEKKKKMFYLLCYFDLPLYFCSFVCFLLSKGLKFKAHTLMWGLANLHSSLNVMKSFCWFKPCVPNCMYIPLSMLWILTVHKKKYEENSVVGCISVNLEEKRKKKEKFTQVVTLCQIYIPKCSQVLTEFCCSL